MQLRTKATRTRFLVDLAIVNQYNLKQNRINLDFLVIWLLQIPQLKKRKQRLTFSADLLGLLHQLLLLEVKTLFLRVLHLLLIAREEAHYLDKNQVDFLDKKSSLVQKSKAQIHYLINPQKKSKRHYFSHKQVKFSKFRIHSRNPHFWIPLFKCKTNKQKLSHLRLYRLNQSLSLSQQISEICSEINKKINPSRMSHHKISLELHKHQTHYFPNLNSLYLLQNLNHQPQYLVNLNPQLLLKN